MDVIATVWGFSKRLAVDRGYPHTMRYDDSDQARDVAERANALMEKVVLPIERERSGGMAVSSGTIAERRAAAREYDVYARRFPRSTAGWG